MLIRPSSIEYVESICSSLALQIFEICHSDCKSWRYSRRYRKKVLHIPGSCKIWIFSVRCCCTNFSLNLNLPGCHFPGWQKTGLFVSARKLNWKFTAKIFPCFCCLTISHHPTATTPNTYSYFPFENRKFLVVRECKKEY